MANLTSTELNEALLRILDERIKASNRSHRELERTLGIGHGTIGNIFRGVTELRLHHVEALGKIFGLTLEQLLFQALGYNSPLSEEQIDNDTRFARLVADEVVTAIRKHPSPEFCTCAAAALPSSLFRKH